MEQRYMVKEGQFLAVFNSAHHIMKAEDMLKMKGLPILLIPAPRKLMTDCGLAIRFDRESLEAVMASLVQAKLMPEFVSVFENGGYIEYWRGDGAGAYEYQEKHNSEIN